MAYQFTNEASLSAHYADVKARLRGNVQRQARQDAGRIEMPRTIVMDDKMQEGMREDLVKRIRFHEREAERLRNELVAIRTPVRTIINVVADKHHVTLEEIIGPSRSSKISEARHEAMALAYQNRPDLSTPMIARVFNRDHTTLLHAVKKMGVWRGAK